MYLYNFTMQLLLASFKQFKQHSWCPLGGVSCNTHFCYTHWTNERAGRNLKWSVGKYRLALLSSESYEFVNGVLICSIVSIFPHSFRKSSWIGWCVRVNVSTHSNSVRIETRSGTQLQRIKWPESVKRGNSLATSHGAAQRQLRQGPRET